MTQRGDRYVLLTFDTESDQGSWTQEYTSNRKTLPLIDDVLQSRRVRATFFWEGVAAERDPAMVRRLCDAGHEIGAHSYKHESLGDVTYSIPGDRAVLPEEIPNRVRRNAAVLTGITGQKPLSFRAPRLWGSAGLNNVLEAEGFLVDSSYPITSRASNLFPYHPDHDDWALTGDSRILEAPVAGLFDEMLDGLDPDLQESAAEFCLDKGKRTLGQWPILRLFGASAFMSFLRPFVDRQIAERGFSIVCVYLHPWEFTVMPSILSGIEARVHLSRALHENCGESTLQALDELIAMLQNAGFRFVTMLELHELLEARDA